MGQPWDRIVSPEDAEIYKLAGFGCSTGIGQRPALVVIDVQYRTVGRSPKPIREALKEYPTSCGEVGWVAIAHIARIIQVFRELALPVIYPYVALKGAHDGGRFADKVPGIMSVDAEAYAFVGEIAPSEGDITIPKYHPSAFFGTPLSSYLVNLAVDSLVVTGCTTSGCVRSTVVDAFSLGYRVLLPHECVFDRTDASHAVSLFDMANKYADVVTTAEAIDMLRKRR